MVGRGSVEGRWSVSGMSVVGGASVGVSGRQWSVGGRQWMSVGVSGGWWVLVGISGGFWWFQWSFGGESVPLSVLAVGTGISTKKRGLLAPKSPKKIVSSPVCTVPIYVYS